MRSSDKHDPIPEEGKRDTGRGKRKASGDVLNTAEWEASPMPRRRPGRRLARAAPSLRRRPRNGKRGRGRPGGTFARIPSDSTSPFPSQNGADVHQADKYGATALMWASSNGHSDIATVLLRVPPSAHLHPLSSPVPNMGYGRVGCADEALPSAPCTDVGCVDRSEEGHERRTASRVSSVRPCTTHRTPL